MKKYLLKSICFVQLILTNEAYSHVFMPENDLHLTPEVMGGTTEEQFHQLIDQVEQVYTDIFAYHNANLNIERYWDNDTVNANASQNFGTWTVRLYGGLARRTSLDAFTLVICHELGHHLAGSLSYPNKNWASNEGQSDYFASLSCARKLWQQQTEKYVINESKLKALPGGEEAKSNCNQAWDDEDSRQICYRTAVAAKELSELLAKKTTLSTPNLNTPDMSRALKTNHSHPQAQCRLDTYIAGSLCKARWDDEIIPGKYSSNSSGLSGLIEAKPYSCHRFDSENAFRPACWFKLPSAPKIQFQQTIEMPPLESGEKKLVRNLNVQNFDTLNVYAKGRHVQLLVDFNNIPDQNSYQCRSRIPLIPRMCLLGVPKGMKTAHIVLKGEEKAKPSKVKLTMKMSGKGRMCRDQTAAFGEAFECYKGLKCRVSEGGDRSHSDTWCIDF